MAPFRLLAGNGPRQRRIALREHIVTEDDGIIEVDVEALLVELGGPKVLRKHAGGIESVALNGWGSMLPSPEPMATDPALETWLKAFLEVHGGIAGTVHVRSEEMLLLRAAVNIPPPVARATENIPKGKGMAGLAWERQRAVAVCNIKTDSSGDVRPGAKAVDAQAALAIPVRNEAGDVRAVVGIAFLGERDFTDADLERFENEAGALPSA
jgi:hypothetical protein